MTCDKIHVTLICVKWHVTSDKLHNMWHVTRKLWNVESVISQLACDKWHVKCGMRLVTCDRSHYMWHAYILLLLSPYRSTGSSGSDTIYLHISRRQILSNSSLCSLSKSQISKETYRSVYRNDNTHSNIENSGASKELILHHGIL